MQSHYQLERTHHPMCPHGRQSIDKQQLATDHLMEPFQLPPPPPPTSCAQPLQPDFTSSSAVAVPPEPPLSPGSAVNQSLTNDIIDLQPNKRRTTNVDYADGQQAAPQTPSAHRSTAVGFRSTDEPDLTSATHRLKAENHYL